MFLSTFLAPMTRRKNTSLSIRQIKVKSAKNVNNFYDLFSGKIQICQKKIVKLNVYKLSRFFKLKIRQIKGKYISFHVNKLLSLF